jgi:hypothetical protein
LGKPHLKESKLKMSSIRKTKNLVGPRSSNWKGGIGCKASGYNSIYVPYKSSKGIS